MGSMDKILSDSDLQIVYAKLSKRFLKILSINVSEGKIRFASSCAHFNREAFWINKYINTEIPRAYFVIFSNKQLLLLRQHKL